MSDPGAPPDSTTPDDETIATFVPLTPTPAAVPPASVPAPSPPAVSAPVAATCGTVTHLHPVEGKDPLVVQYARRFPGTCALRTFSWLWLIVGMLSALAGGIAANHLGGAVQPLEGEYGPLKYVMNELLGNWTVVLLGMAVAALVASTMGVWVNRRRAPCGQEPLIGGLLMALAFLWYYYRPAAVDVVGCSLTLIYFLAIAFRLLALSVGGKHGLRSAILAEPPGGWPLYTVLVPLYKERNVAKNILVSLEKLDYPRDKLDVKFLLEADDPETLLALTQAGIPAWAEVLVVPLSQPKTKPRACNHGLATARGTFLVVFDAEDRPEPDQLKQAVHAFMALPPKVVCLQAQLAYHNCQQNLLTRWFSLEYNVWFRRYLSGLVALGVPIPLGGTSNHFRTQTLQQIGGWDPFNVTEDCDLGVRLYMQGFKTRTLDSTTWEEANSRVGNWIRQRSRWLKGYLITHLVWGRRPVYLLWKLNPWGAFGFIMSVFCVSSLAALNLILWVITTVYLALIAVDISHGFALWDLLSTRDLLHERLSWPMIFFNGPYEDPVLASMSQIFFLASVCLLVGNFAFVLVNALAGRRPGQRNLWVAALLSPLYWVLISIAAWKGIWQLLWKPHYWEKTVHGLDHDNHGGTSG